MNDTCKYCGAVDERAVYGACVPCRELERRLESTPPEIVYKMLVSVAPAALGENTQLVTALKKLRDAFATIDTPLEHEFGERWAMIVDEIASFGLNVVHEALGELKPTTVEEAAIERVDAWLSTYARELASQGQHDETTPESTTRGAAAYLVVTETRKAMRESLNGMVRDVETETTALKKLASMAESVSEPLERAQFMRNHDHMRSAVIGIANALLPAVERWKKARS